MSEETNITEEVTENIAENIDLDELGNVNISDDVIASVVGMTLADIKGICPNGGSFGSIAERFSGKRNMGRGVKVVVEGKTVSLDLHLIVEYGIKIPDVAWEAQEKVKDAVESITGLTVDKVNVHVEGVSVVKETKAEKKTVEVPAAAEEAAEAVAGEVQDMADNVSSAIEDDLADLKKLDDFTN